jgi:hypothetical protein
MNLQVTKILRDKLKRDIIEVDTTNYSDIDNYHCNLLKFGKNNGVLITNDKTLFSFFIYGLKANDFKHFEEVLRESIFKLLINGGLSQNQFEKVLNSMENFQYSKTSNKSVISSMNDMKRMIEGFLYGGDDIFEINKKLNQIPYKSNKYKYSIKLFKELLDK